MSGGVEVVVAAGLGVIVDGVRVTAEGGFVSDTWVSTGVGYTVTVDPPADAAELDALLTRVDEVAARAAYE